MFTLNKLKQLIAKSTNLKPNNKKVTQVQNHQLETPVKVTYQAPATIEKTVDVNESDLPILYGAIRDCFLHRIQTFGLADPYLPFEFAISEFLAKAGIDPKNRIEVVSFLQGFLVGGIGDTVPVVGPTEENNAESGTEPNENN